MKCITKLISSASIATLTMSLAIPAYAQDVAPDPSTIQAELSAVSNSMEVDGGQPGEDKLASESAPVQDANDAGIVVTGTRLGGGFFAPTPVTALDADQLIKKSPNDLAEALNSLPQLKGSLRPGQTYTPSVGQGTSGQSLLSMRNLGAARTLILLDGNRLPVTNNAGSTDINIIPQALVKRVDLVTGGASASYGSDAVAGVINFVLDTRFEGVKLDLNTGITTYGDNESGRATLAVGKSFAGGRAHIIASADYYRAAAIGYSNEPNGRDWYDNPSGAYNNVSGGVPRILVVPQVRHAEATSGGLITSGPLRGFQFGPGGTVIPFDGGTTPNLRNTSGGDGGRTTAQLSPDQERGGGFIHAEYDLNDSTTVFVEGMYNFANMFAPSFPTYQYRSATQLRIFRDNAFLPQPVVDMFTANPALQSFTVGRFSEDMTPNTVRSKTTLKRIATGIRGDLSGTWKYDANLLYSKVFQDLSREQTINRNVYAAADAVRNPANGQIVCRSQLSGLDPDCVPMNIFGNGSVSQEANDYVIGVNYSRSNFEQTAFNANVRGDLGERFNLGAGPILLALGVAYRNETVDRVVDPLSNIFVDCTGVRGCPTAMNTGTFYGGYLSGNFAPLSGRVSASEGYAELGIPLLKDQSFTKSLNLTVAGRATDYNLSGLAYTWKTGVNWEPFDSLRFRFTRSRDIRAPNTAELFGGGATNTILGTFPGSPLVFSGPTYTLNMRGIEGIGNPDLSPEKADTLTFGAVYRPAWIPGLQASLDYYSVKISGAIAEPQTQDVIDACYSGDQYFCGMLSITGVPITNVSQITPGLEGVQVRALPSNIGRQETSGLDLEIAYSQPLASGRFNSRLYANYLLTAVDDSISGAKLIGSVSNGLNFPRWSGSLSLEYASDGLSLYVEERVISKGKRNVNFVEGVNITTNDVPAIAYTDVTATYRFLGPIGSRSEAFINITNLLNQAPPNTNIGVSTTNAITNYSLYDVVGRRFTAGIRFRW